MPNTSTAAHNPDGKVLLPLPIWVRGAAVFGGANQEYRYELSRTWDDALSTLLFVMMNPSTASPAFDDPTVAKCRRYAEDWGFGTLLVGNTCAYRATSQKRLTEIADPVGPDNNAHLLSMADSATMIVCGLIWGAAVTPSSGWPCLRSKTRPCRGLQDRGTLGTCATLGFDEQNRAVV